MDKLIEIVTECLEHNVPITGVALNDRKDFVFELQGFSKSGTGFLTKDDEGNVILKTRYNEIDRIEDFNDIAYAAKRWQQYRPDYYSLPEYFNI